MQLTYEDQEHLKMLTIFHYIMAALTACFSCMGLIYVVMGIAMMSGSFGRGVQAPPAFMGIVFAIMGGALTLLGWIFAIVTFFAGRNIAQRRRYTFCLIVAGLNCMSFPFGTILGVFTFIVLFRPQVKEAFTGVPSAAPIYPVPPAPPAPPAAI